MKKISLSEYSAISGSGVLSEKTIQVDSMLKSFLDSKTFIVEIEETDCYAFDLSTPDTADDAAKTIRWRISSNEEWKENIKLSKRGNRLFLLRR